MTLDGGSLPASFVVQTIDNLVFNFTSPDEVEPVTGYYSFSGLALMNDTSYTYTANNYAGGSAMADTVNIAIFSKGAPPELYAEITGPGTGESDFVVLSRSPFQPMRRRLLNHVSALEVRAAVQSTPDKCSISRRWRASSML